MLGACISEILGGFHYVSSHSGMIDDVNNVLLYQCSLPHIKTL